MKTIRLWLESDPEIPQFQRLGWEFVDVSIQDILLRGIHPWMGPDKHMTLSEAFLKCLNTDHVKVGSLSSMNYSNDVSLPPYYMGNGRSQFERAMDIIQKDVYFVSDMSYLGLLELAKERLRGRWSRHLARKLAEDAYPRFAELRAFLKTKKKDMKLSGISDLDQYDLGRILSVDDFEEKDALLIAEGLPARNFRRIGFLNQVTDEDGRLRLVNEIHNLVVYPLTRTSSGYTPLECHWMVRRKGNGLTFYPNLARCPWWRQDAEAFAKKWGKSGAKRVFETDVDHLAEMITSGAARADFSPLNYSKATDGGIARAEVVSSVITAYGVGGGIGKNLSGETLKEVLREYGVAMTGTKEELLAKVAKLAAKEYEKRKEELDDYFDVNRFVRITFGPTETMRFPVVEGARYLRDVITAMYLAKHTRGAIVEARRENEAYSAEELAMALLRGQVAASGAYLRVA